MISLAYPKTSNIDAGHGTKPRVIFRSYKWKIAKPQVKETKLENSNIVESMIQLYLPANFSEKYSAKWEHEAMFHLADGKAAGLAGAVRDYMKQKNLQGILNSGIYSEGATRFPGSFKVFTQVDPMNLSFSFEMIPKSRPEAVEINNIIQTFKREILPIYNGMLLEFPNIWSIHFDGIIGPGFPAYKDSNSTQFGKYYDMALVDVYPEYIGGTSQTALVYSDSYPVGVKLNLTFSSIKFGYKDESEGNYNTNSTYLQNRAVNSLSVDTAGNQSGGWAEMETTSLR